MNSNHERYRIQVIGKRKALSLRPIDRRKSGDRERHYQMRICYIAGGTSIHTQRWVNRFARMGHEVHLIASRFSDGYDENVHLHPLPRLLPQMWGVSKYPSAALWPFRIRGMVNRIEPDILHAHYVTMSGYLGAFSGFHPFVLTAWGSDILIDPKRSVLFRILTEYSLKKADLITCDADHIVEELVELGAKQDKIEVIYFGTDVEKFKPEQKDRKLREQLGILNSPTVISLRSLKPHYDVESLIKAIPRVLRECPEAKFIIAGEGEQRDYLEALPAPFRENVRFVGWLPNDEIPKYLTSADVYVSTSLSDAGLAGSTAEAMACGLPVVITDFGDNRKWVRDGINGFVVPLKDPVALASRIVYLLRNEDARKKFGRVNRQIIDEKNNWKKEMDRMGELYRKLSTI